MTVSVRGQIQQRIDPTYFQAKAPAGTDRIAQPIDMLGSPPEKDVVYVSPAAEALMSDQAASVEAPFTPPFEPGGSLDVSA